MITTIEGREDLRRWMLEQAEIFTAEGTLQVVPREAAFRALDGLDIAEKMAAHMEGHPMTASGRCRECKRLSRLWATWKGER